MSVKNLIKTNMFMLNLMKLQNSDDFVASVWRRALQLFRTVTRAHNLIYKMNLDFVENGGINTSKTLSRIFSLKVKFETQSICVDMSK